MMLLEANNLKLYAKERLLVDVDDLQIRNKDRIGLVGRNGSGKTTLLEVLAGKRSHEVGTVASGTKCELLPQLKRTDTTKSGGELTQEYIVDKVITKDPKILFADEPTTNLDTAHIEWLEKQLLSWQGAFVIVSHDRTFLDNICTSIWEIDEGRVKEYKGNYSDYAQQKELERHQHEMAYEKYMMKKKQLEEALALQKNRAASAKKKTKKENSSEANTTGDQGKKQKKFQQTIKSLKTRLDKLEKVEKPKDPKPVKMRLPNEVTFKGRLSLRVNNVSGVIGDKTLWKAANFEVRDGDKLAIIGPNGSGKTTLVKKMIHRDEGATTSPSMKIGYFSQNLDVLNSEKSVLDNVSSTSKQDETINRTVLARLHFFRDDVYKPVKVLSGGERLKVVLAKLIVSDINTLILDEPTNFLDTEAIEALESLLEEYKGIVIFVSHDRRFISNIANRILTIDNEEIHLFEGTYDEYKLHEPQENKNIEKEDKRLILDMKISEVLGRLSIEPSEELELEFQKLLAEKRMLDKH